MLCTNFGWSKARIHLPLKLNFWHIAKFYKSTLVSYQLICPSVPSVIYILESFQFCSQQYKQHITISFTCSGLVFSTWNAKSQEMHMQSFCNNWSQHCQQQLCDNQWWWLGRRWGEPASGSPEAANQPLLRLPKYKKMLVGDMCFFNVHKCHWFI